MKKVFVIAAMVFVLSGCKMKVDQTYTFTGEETFDTEIVIAVDEEMKALFEQEGEEFTYEALSEDLDIPEDVNYETSPYSEGVFEGIVVSVPDISLSDQFSIMNDDSESDEQIFVTDGDGIWRLSDAASGATDDLAEQGDDFDMAPEMFIEASLTVSNIEIIETNGTVDGNSVTWGNELLETPPTLEFRPIGPSSSDSGGSIGTVVAVMLGGVFLVAVIVGIAVLIVRRREPEPPAYPPPSV